MTSITPDGTPDGAPDGASDDQPPAELGPAQLVAEAHRVIDGRSVRSVFQPLVHLATNEVVGYEALSRGPAGSALELPLDLLAAAKAAGRLDELDWLCAASACEAAVEAGLNASMSVFLNFEPTTLLRPCPED
ncbi:MAG: EAL domain-containing protein, partial [Acidimicrobiales bacterium]